MLGLFPASAKCCDTSFQIEFLPVRLQDVPNVGDAGHVEVGHFDQLLQGEGARIAFVGQLIARDFADVADEVDDPVVVQSCRHREDRVQLGLVDLGHHLAHVFQLEGFELPRTRSVPVVLPILLQR